ncbi:MAG: glycosyltransferase family 2 protein [Campylobacterales bacterium]|nr:glycosyltransferase family 2 protein [Campylobacterales bacterium]
MITILTPTYNRAHTLPALFESLKVQSVPFEWIVIDDGSNDGTTEIVNSFKSTATFPIIYTFQPNGGKHSALNRGSQIAKGEWIFIVDSDDTLTTDALSLVVNTSYNLPLGVLGFAFRRMHSNGNIIGKMINVDDPMELTPTQASSLFSGDLAYIFRKETLQKHPFPIIKNELFVPELYIWNKISDSGKIIYFPSKAIYITEYLEDGYSKNFKQNLKRNPQGFALFYRDQFFRETSPIQKIKNAIRYLQCLYYEIIQ